MFFSKQIYIVITLVFPIDVAIEMTIVFKVVVIILPVVLVASVL